VTFGEASFRVEPGGYRGTAFLAATEPQRERGLMGRRSLDGHDGMLFVFLADTDVSFYMRDTPLPLSVAWFAADGTFVAAAELDPCPDRPGCKLYAPPRSYRTALEVARGDLARLGIGPGSQLTIERRDRS